ncbi:MAG: hypothetical protein IKP62_02690 [Salinivirgaceae bacterium]|nr:hypothetical protein [Salinivirgaceae bacterium]
MGHGVGLWAVNIADHIALGCAVGYGRQRGRWECPSPRLGWKPTSAADAAGLGKENKQTLCGARLPCVEVRAQSNPSTAKTTYGVPT